MRTIEYASFHNPHVELHTVIIAHEEFESDYVSILLVPCFLETCAHGQFFALLKDPHSRQWREFKPVGDEFKGDFVLRIKATLEAENYKREHLAPA